MKLFKFKKILYVFALNIALAGCVGGKETPSPQTYAIASLAPAASTSTVSPILLMMPAQIAPQFSNFSFIYRTSSTQYLMDPYRQFLTAPNLEISNYLQNKLTTQLKTTVVGAESLLTPQFILQENIVTLYADYRDKIHPSAVIEISFSLYQINEKGMSQLATTTLTSAHDILPNNPSALISGYQACLDEIANGLNKFLTPYLNKK